MSPLVRCDVLRQYPGASMRARALALALVLVLAVSLTASVSVRAQPDAGIDPNALVLQAEEAEARSDPRAALAAWQALVNGAPTSRLARRGRERIAWIQARQCGHQLPSCRAGAAARAQSCASGTEALPLKKKDFGDPGGLIRLCRCPALARTKVVSGPNRRAVP